MATSGTNYTVKWVLSNGVLTVSPASGNSGIARRPLSYFGGSSLTQWITLTDSEVNSVQTIVFSGSVQFYTADAVGGTYSKETLLLGFLRSFINASTIDVAGLNTAGVTDFSSFFPAALSTLRNLTSMNVASGVDFSNMFAGTRLQILNLSNYPLNAADSLIGMVSDMDYCHTIILPSGFNRRYSSKIGSLVYYNFGLASSKVHATKNGVTVTSDEDFFKLDSAQGGTWTRDVSGTASLSFRVTGTSRDANTGTIDYTYATTSATADVYLKKTSESSFPSTASQTVTITGSGTGSINLTLPTDDAYDAKIVVSDGTTSLYLYPSISSNVLLLDISESGDLTAAGKLRAKTEQITPTFATTDGSVYTYRVRRFGNVVMLILSVRSRGSVAVGSMVFQSTVSGIPLPPWSVSSACYYGNANLMAQLDRNGVVTLRNTWTQAINIASPNFATVSFTYIVD